MAINPTFERIEELYNETLDASRTQEIQTLVEEVKGQPDVDEARRLAYEAIIALCDYLNQWNGVTEERLEDAKNEISAALRIDPKFAPAHYAMGFLHRKDGNHALALMSFTQAAKLDAKYARAFAQRAAELLYLGFPEKASAEIQKAIDLSPESPTRGMFFWIRARIFFFTEKYQEAIPWLQQSIALWPKLWYNHLYLASAFAILEQDKNARQALIAFANADPRFKDYTVKHVIDNERTNPNKIHLVVEGRRKFHVGLIMAGMPPGDLERGSL